MQVPAIRLDDSCEDDEKDLTVAVVSEDVLAAIAAWERMMCSAGLLAARLAWHNDRSGSRPEFAPCPPEKGVSPLDPPVPRKKGCYPLIPVTGHRTRLDRDPGTVRADG